MMRLAGHAQAEDRVAGRGQLVDQLARGRAAVEGAGVGFLQNDHAAALDARVVGVDGGGDEIGEAHVGDEAAALVDLQHGSWPSFHSAIRTLPPSIPVSTPT